jgi:hypothetical protein
MTGVIVPVATVREITARWASRLWPSIGYFVHGQAFLDIHTLQERIGFLEQGVRDIQQATLDGTVCDDVAWFSEIETLHDHCGWLLDPENFYVNNLSKV